MHCTSGGAKIYWTGALDPLEEDRVDEDSVAFFQEAEENLVGAPLSYNAVSQGGQNFFIYNPAQSWTLNTEQSSLFCLI